MDSIGLLLTSGTHGNHTSTLNVNTDLEYLIGVLSIISYIIVAGVIFVYSKGDHVFLGVNTNNVILFSTAFVATLANLSIKTGTFHDIYILGMFSV